MLALHSGGPGNRGIVSPIWHLPHGSVVKNPPANARERNLILGSGRSPGEGNGNHSSILATGNPMDRGAWWATVHGIVKETDMT